MNKHEVFVLNHEGVYRNEFGSSCYGVFTDLEEAKNALYSIAFERTSKYIIDEGEIEDYLKDRISEDGMWFENQDEENPDRLYVEKVYLDPDISSLA